MNTYSDRLAALGGMDSAKAAGLFVIGSVIVLGLLRRGFSGVAIHLGD